MGGNSGEDSIGGRGIWSWGGIDEREMAVMLRRDGWADLLLMHLNPNSCQGKGAFSFSTLLQAGPEC